MPWRRTQRIYAYWATGLGRTIHEAEWWKAQHHAAFPTARPYSSSHPPLATDSVHHAAGFCFKQCPDWLALIAAEHSLLTQVVRLVSTQPHLRVRLETWQSHYDYVAEHDCLRILTNDICLPSITSAFFAFHI